MKKTLLISAFTAAVLTMTGCGSSDTTDDNTGAKTLKAQFIDSPVQGVDYDCQSSGHEGVTDANGYFSYVAGDTCTFSVGTVALGTTKPTGSVVTPRDLSDKPAEVTNILRLLQTLDTDAKPENGITLPEDIVGSVDLGDNFEAEIGTFISTNEDKGTVSSGTIVVSAEDAEAHFEKTITELKEDNSGSGEDPDSPMKKVLLDLGATIDPTTTAKSIMTEGLFSTGVSINQGSGYAGIFSLKLDASNKLVQYNYDQKSDTFIAKEDDKREHYDVTLIDGVWIKTTQNQSLTFNSDGDFIVSSPTLGEVTSKLDALNISGLNIADINNSTSSAFIDTDEPLTDVPNFSEGAKAYTYNISSTLFKPYYEINSDYHQLCSWNDQTGEEECTERYGDTIEGYDSISQFIADYTLNSDSNYSLTMYDNVNKKPVNVSFSSSNTLVITNTDTYMYDGSTDSTAASTSIYPNGSYEVKTVGSTQILVLTLPEMLVDEHEKNEKRIYSIYDGKLSRGSYIFAEDKAGANFVWFNETAARDIYTFGQSFTPKEVSIEDANTSKELTQDLIGTWNNTTTNPMTNEYGVEETVTRTSNITATETTISDVVVTDSAEKHEVISIVSTYQATGTNTLSDNTSVTKLTETYTQYTYSVTLKTEAAVNYYNQNSKFDISDWSVNVPRDCSSSYSPFIGYSYNDIFSVTDGQLIFGNFGTKDDNGYPTELNTYFSYTQTVN